MVHRRDISVREHGQTAVDDGHRRQRESRTATEALQALRLESAPIALEISRELCQHAIAGDSIAAGRDCSAMHGNWQYLLLLGLTASPERNEKFYREAIRRLAQDKGVRRLLVAGCCDYTMLSITLSAFEGLAITPQITVIDRCGTPLYLCRWFADRYGCDIVTEKADILAYAPTAPFDLICTDGLITVFSRDTRPDLVASWYRLLRPGGYVVTTNNLGQAGKDTTLPPDAVAALCEKAVELRERRRIEIDLSDEALRRRVCDFFSRQRPQYVDSAKEFKALFRANAFRIVRLEVSAINGIAIGDTDENGNILKTLNARLVAERL